MATIKAIEGRSVHQIQSGQVIVDLISVVKELVENSLDAGATSIDIRFRNHGLDSIEVQDNGNGIAPEDFETIALKHYTSKLSNFEDLDSLHTFGFRGEALSSMCALSKFSIVTARAQDESVGKKLDFESSGKLSGTSVVAAQKGTTVAVESLFASLPVRRKELEKNIKREYGKVLTHLYAYACISVGVRFSVSNQMPKAQKALAFSTKANPTTKENIANIFGAKTLQSLVTLDLRLQMQPNIGPSTQSARNWSTQTRDLPMDVHVQGHISKPVFGEGRQAPDRQMLFVNSRPCLLPQVSKVFNEVYRSFNVSQTPFVFANLVMDTNSYDVNISPDKRTIMLHDQTALLESLKQSLTELFERSDYTVPQSTLSNRKLPSYKPLTIPERSMSRENPSDDGGEPAELSGIEDDESDEDTARNSHKADTPLSLIKDWTGRGTIPREEVRPPRQKSSESVSKDQPSIGSTVRQERAQSSEILDQNPALPGFSRPSINMNESDNEDHDVVQPTAASENSSPDALQEHDDDVRGIAILDSHNQTVSSEKDRNLQRRVEDFKALIDGKNATPGTTGTPARRVDEQPTTAMDDTMEYRIPAIATSSPKATPGPVQNAFDRMRPMRTPLQTAEITIGDTTTMTVIGTDPPYKKRRIHQPLYSQSITRFCSSPLLSRGLSSFAAPGSQMDTGSNEVPTPIPESREMSGEEDHDDDNDDDENEDEDEDEHEMEEPASDPQSEQSGDRVDVDEYDPDDDDDYLDEEEKKIREDEKVARLIHEAELAAARPTEENLRRAAQVLKNTGNRKDSPLQLMQLVETNVEQIRKQIVDISATQPAQCESSQTSNTVIKDEIDDSNAESRLSLTVSKSDFEKMAIIGQFNLGFILAVRLAEKEGDEDELFIIDQHAADEKYNYERLQRTVTLQSQRLVRPKQLDLTAMEEEIILNHASALKANGFEIETIADIDTETTSSSHRQRHLLTLPISKEKTFTLSDLEELLHLLSEAPAGSTEIPRPKKVQSMLAMRACRSSIMVGKTLTLKQMQKVVRHMGEMEKPWNCPHGRPTMRHLAGLGSWWGWREGEVVDEEMGGGGRTDWKRFLERKG